jgi:hypothetical protein
MKDETIGIQGLAFHEPLLFDQGSKGGPPVRSRRAMSRR